MTPDPKPHDAHIEQSEHSTDEVDTFLDHVEGHVHNSPGAGSPAIKPNKALGEDGKPASGRNVSMTLRHPGTLI